MIHKQTTPKNQLKKLLFIVFLAQANTLYAGTLASGQTGIEAASVSPYFHIEGNDDGTDRFPLKKTRADVQINGVIASVKITQVYSNQGKNPLNATYIFPGSTKAAVNGMTMTIGERRIIARIKEKEAAKAEFNEAKAQGKSASLLSQKRPNVFSMEVANVLPGDELTVELSYTEIITAEQGVYEFVYPGVVGPRYGGDAGSSQQETQWVANPYLKTGVTPEDKAPDDGVEYRINVNMNSPLAIQDLASATHTLDIKWENKKSANIHLQGTDKQVGNRDFILRYRLQDEKIVSGLTHFSWNGENYFMLLAEPPKRVMPEQVTAREYFFVVDVSGSMHGFPLNVATELMGNLLQGMKPVDRFNILFFSGGSQVLSSTPLQATEENTALGIAMMRNQRGSGGTELYPALLQAINMPTIDNMSRSIVVVTDGYISAEDEMFRLINESLGEANVFAFGIGASVNRHLIEGLAKAGHAESFVVTNQEEAKLQSRKFIEYIQAPVLTHIQLDAVNADIYDMEPEFIPDLLGERPVMILGKYKAINNGPVKFELTGVSGKGHEKWQFEASDKQLDATLPQLWARKRLEQLYVIPRGSKEEMQENITQLGLQYSLLTQYTSFVAVDEMIRHAGSPASDVKQPLPLPQGVSNLAVGSHAMPEPEQCYMIVFMLLFIIWKTVRQQEEHHARS